MGVATLTVKGKPGVDSVLEIVTVKFTTVPKVLGVTDAGEKEHPAPAGNWPQLRFTA